MMKRVEDIFCIVYSDYNYKVRFIFGGLHETNKFVRSEFFAANAPEICAEVEFRKFSANSQRIIRFAKSRNHSYFFAAKFFEL